MILLLSNLDIRSYDERGNCYKVDHRAVVDLTVRIGSRKHLFFMIPAAIILLVYSILQPLLLILHPFKTFRSCLSRCHLDIIAVYIFVAAKTKWLLSKQFGRWTRYEELVWPLLLSQDDSVPSWTGIL